MKKTAATALPPRDRMIEATIGLLRGSGLAGAGMNEIVRLSAAPKGSVYHYFPDGKHQLAREALAVYQGRALAFMEAALASKRSPDAKIKALFAAFARRLEDADFRASCAGGTVVLDLDLEPPVADLRVAIESMFDAFVALIARHVALADPAQNASFAGLVLTAIEGGYVRGRAERSSRAFNEAGQWLAKLAKLG
jgi:TetR/AcrR family transcriptional regulator, lmrAB and yxaGH operons repressor